MIDPSKYGDKIQYYEAIRSLFVKVGKYFGVEYEGLTIDEALNEAVFDKFNDEEITSQDVEVVSLLYLADLINQLSINLPEGDYETKARLTAFDLELKRLQESVTSIAGKETKVITNTTEVKTLDLTALDGIKAKMLQLQSSIGDVKTLEIKQLSNSIKMNEIMTELDSITEQIQLLAQEFNTWKNKKAVLIKGGDSGASFGSQLSIQFRDEGVALGTAGTVNEMDFVGTGVSATRVGNKITVTINGGGVTDHGALTGLADDDHTQYHNDARGDARYYTQSQLNAGQLDSRYYTETETDTLLGGKSNNGHTHTVSNITDYATATDTRIDNKIVEVKKGGVEFQLYRSSGLQVNDFTKAIIASAGTITAWTVATRDGTNGTITLNVKKASYANVPTFSAIDGTEQITLSTQSKNQDNALSSWTTAVAAGDHIEISVASVTGTVTGVYGIINITKS